VRIRGGVPRTYYVGVESSMPAVPGMPTPVKAVAVAPFGMEEGSSVRCRVASLGSRWASRQSFRLFSVGGTEERRRGTVLGRSGGRT